MTIQTLADRIASANALGVQNLAAKGVTVAANADTHTVMNAIDDVPTGGNGVRFTRCGADGRPPVVDLTDWTPASFAESTGYGITSCCIPPCSFMSDTPQGMYYAMTKLICPHAVTGIGNKAFYYLANFAPDADCFSFARLEIIGSNAFYRCQSLNANGAMTDLSLPLVRHIGATAFSGSVGHEFLSGNVVIGSPGHPVTTIASNAFQNQRTVTSITVYTNNGATLSYENGTGWGCGTAATFVPA